MKGIKKSIRSGISAFLLLCFSVSVIPVDFFHNHQPERIVCKDTQANQPCKHSFHVSSVKSFCWVCAIHIDGQFTPANVFEKIASFPALRLFLENEIASHFFECLFYPLRGPPQN